MFSIRSFFVWLESEGTQSLAAFVLSVLLSVLLSVFGSLFGAIALMIITGGRGV